LRLTIQPIGTLGALAAAAIVMSYGCSVPAQGELAIYLTRDDIPPAQMEALSHVELADEPIISCDDIVTYDATSHGILLTSAAYERLAAMEVPTSGTSFVVCVGGSPIYRGAFWTRLSSQSFDGVTILTPLTSQPASVVRLELGYPSPGFYSGDDPRSTPEVLLALEQAGKLRGAASATTALPDSLKGYELYSWHEHDGWHFVLMTGTNRTKATEEVLSVLSELRDDGWVHIHALGVHEIGRVLRRLPEGENVIWKPAIGDVAGDAITPPPSDIADAVAGKAATCGMRLHV